jgi:hypothetical protein
VFIDKLRSKSNSSAQGSSVAFEGTEMFACGVLEIPKVGCEMWDKDYFRRP